MEVSRRWFLGGLCASLPLVGMSFGGRRIREAEYTIGFEGCIPIVVTAFTNGDLEAIYNGQWLPMAGDDNWRTFEGRVGSERVRIVVRRLEAGSLDIDSFATFQQSHAGDEPRFVAYPTHGQTLFHEEGYMACPKDGLRLAKNSSVQIGAFGKRSFFRL